MQAVAGQERQLERRTGRPCTDTAKIARLDTDFNKHWPGPFKTGYCCVCSARGVTWKVQVKCLKSAVTLHVDKMCCADYHTRMQLPYTNLKPGTKM